MARATSARFGAFSMWSMLTGLCAVMIVAQFMGGLQSRFAAAPAGSVPITRSDRRLPSDCAAPLAQALRSLSNQYPARTPSSALSDRHLLWLKDVEQVLFELTGERLHLLPGERRAMFERPGVTEGASVQDTAHTSATIVNSTLFQRSKRGKTHTYTSQSSVTFDSIHADGDRAHSSGAALDEEGGHYDEENDDVLETDGNEDSEDVHIRSMQRLEAALEALADGKHQVGSISPTAALGMNGDIKRGQYHIKDGERHAPVVSHNAFTSEDATSSSHSLWSQQSERDSWSITSIDDSEVANTSLTAAAFNGSNASGTEGGSDTGTKNKHEDGRSSSITVDPWNEKTGIYIWDWFPPTYPCRNGLERVGRVGDGGKWVCGLPGDRHGRNRSINASKTPGKDARNRSSRKKSSGRGSGCIMYSFGIRDDISFEKEVVDRTGCTVHAFDPTIPGLPEASDAANESLNPAYQTGNNRTIVRRNKRYHSGIHFHKQALWSSTGSSSEFLLTETLHDTMRNLGHSVIDILKVDVEGSEWAVFEQMFNDNNVSTSDHVDSNLGIPNGSKHSIMSRGGIYSTVRNKVGGSEMRERKAPVLPVNQLLIELHFERINSTFQFFHRLFEDGLRVFHSEVNHQPCVAGRLPVAVEYSFMRPIPLKGASSGRAVKSSAQEFKLNTEHSGMTTVNGVIYSLIYGATDFKRLQRMLSSLDTFFNDRYHYPVILFSENTTEAQKRFIRSSTRSNVTFRDVSFTVPNFIDPSVLPVRTKCAPSSSTIGYRHMCRFHAMEAHDILSKEMGYEWHWRLDDDSELTSEIGYDIFQLMKAANKRYGFVNSVNDDPECIEGLWEAADVFANSKNQTNLQSLEQNATGFYGRWPRGRVFYNNFEISHHSVWDSPVYRAWFAQVDGLEGIYTRRWGDAPIKSIGVALQGNCFCILLNSCAL